MLFLIMPQAMFDDLYSECTCWYCESIRESMTSSLTRLVKGDKVTSAAIKEPLARLHAAPSPADGNLLAANHISTHNAVRAPELGSAKTTSRVEKHQLEVGYKRACLRAKKEGRAGPTRPDRNAGGQGTYVDPYGHAVIIPYPLYYPYPYACDPCYAPGIYAANPGCVAGNCCQGTCGAGV